MLSTLKNSFIKIHECAQTFLHVHAHANTLIPAPRRTHTHARAHTRTRAHGVCILLLFLGLFQQPTLWIQQWNLRRH